MKRIIVASQSIPSIDEDFIDGLLEHSPQRRNGPRRYLYAICEYLEWNPPMFIDNVADGVRLRYHERTAELAEQTVEAIRDAARALGIPLYKAEVKPGAPQRHYYAYVVVPRFN